MTKNKILFSILILFSCLSSISFGQEIRDATIRNLVSRGFKPEIAQKILLFRPDVAKFSVQAEIEASISYPDDLKAIPASRFSQSTKAITLYRGICLNQIEDYNPRFNNFSAAGFPSPHAMYVVTAKDEKTADNFTSNCHSDGFKNSVGIKLEFQVPRYAFVGDETGGIIVRDFVPDDRPFLVSVTVYQNKLLPSGTLEQSPPVMFEPDNFISKTKSQALKVENPLFKFLQ